MATPIEIGVGVNGKALRDGVEKDIIKPIENAEKALEALGDSGGDAGDSIDGGIASGEKSLRDLGKTSDRTADDLDKVGRAGDDAGDDINKGIDKGEKSLKDLGKSSDRTADDLDKVGRAGDKSGDKIEDALEAAQKESDRTRQELDALGDAISRAGSKGKDLDDGIRVGAEGAGESVAEFKDEAIGNLSETVSSFRGDGEDLVQILQDTFGGVVANLGPAGMAAGVAGAVGIGLIMGAFEKAQEAEKEFRERVVELAGALIEHGGKGADGVQAIADGIKGLALESDDGKKKLTDVAREAKAVGVEVKGLAQAYGGSADALDKYGTKAAELAKEERTHARASEVMAGTSRKNNQDKIADYTSLIDSVEALKEEQAAAAEIEQLWHETGGAAIEARAAQLDTLQGELDSAVGEWSEYQDAETGALDPAGYIAAMQARMDATSNFSSNVDTIAQKFGLSFEEQQAILDQGVDFAPMLQSIIDNGLDAEFAAKIQAAVGGGQAILDGSPLDTTVIAAADVKAAQGDLDKTATDRDTTIDARADVRRASSDLDATAAKKRTAPITARASTSDAERALANLARSRSAQVTASAQTWAAETALTYLTRTRRATIIADVVDREGKPVKP